MLNFTNYTQNVRNRWIGNKNLGECIELNGSITKKSFNEYGKSTQGNWKNLLNKSVEEIKSKKIQ